MVTAKDLWKLVGLLWLCFLFAQIVLFALMGFFKGKLTVEVLFSLNALALIFVLLLPTILFGLTRNWRWVEAFRLRPASWRIVVVTVFGTIALGLAVSQVTLWLIQKFANSAFVEQSKLTNLLSATGEASSPILLILAVMFPAFPEELVFRGAIQQGFERRYSPLTAIMLTGLIFALFHLDPLQTFSVVAIAMFWGWVAWRSQSVFPSLFAHAFQNALTVISVISAKNANEDILGSGEIFSVSPNWWAALFGLLLWLISVLTLLRLFPRRGDKDGSATFGIHSDQIGFASGSD